MVDWSISFYRLYSSSSSFLLQVGGITWCSYKADGELRLRPFWKHVTFKTFQQTLGACSSEHGSLRGSLSREQCFSLGILRALESLGASAVRRMQGTDRLRIAVICWTLQFWAKPAASLQCPFVNDTLLHFRSQIVERLVWKTGHPTFSAAASTIQHDVQRTSSSELQAFQHHGRKSHSHRVCRLRLLRSAPSSADLQRPWLKCFHKVWPDRARESVRLWTLDISRFCLYKTSTSTRTQKAQQTWRRRSPKSTVGQKVCYFSSNLQVLGFRDDCRECLRAGWKRCDRWIWWSRFHSCSKQLLPRLCWAWFRCCFPWSPPWWRRRRLDSCMQNWGCGFALAPGMPTTVARGHASSTSWGGIGHNLIQFTNKDRQHMTA